MSVRLSLLAILDQGPCYGYQLRTELDRRTGSAGPVNVGQVYNTLDRLERDKLVRKAGNTNYYEITPSGSVEVATWFATRSPLAELPGKLALASTLAGVDVVEILRIQRSSAPDARVPGVTPTTADEVATAIVSTAAAVAAEAELRLLDRVEVLVSRGIAPLPLATETPRRGRPAKIYS